MKYAVEARIYDDGKIVAKVRPALDEEESGCKETRKCDIWVEVFEEESEAIKYCNDYKKA